MSVGKFWLLLIEGENCTCNGIVGAPSLSQNEAKDLGFWGDEGSFWKGQQPEFVGKPGPERSQPGPHQPAARQKDPGYTQWTPIVGGSQLAVDTTLVFPLTHPAGQYEGAALQPARKSKERTYPKLLPSRQGQPSSLIRPHTEPEQFRTSSAKLSKLPSSYAGQPSWHMRPSMRSRPVSWT